MVRGQIVTSCNSSFLSCEKDLQEIIEKLFVFSGPYSEKLKRLLVINNENCLDENITEYSKAMKEYSVKRLKQETYIKFNPKIKFPEHEDIKSYLIFGFDNFVPNATNPQFRDNIVTIDIMCHTDCWDLGDYKIRPLVIAGYIDGILNNSRLTGIGKFEFLGCSELILSENLAGYTLMYKAIHGSDDKIPSKEEAIDNAW